MKIDLEIVSGAFEMRRAQRENSTAPEIWQLLDSVYDPEIPVLSLWDLGVLTDIEKFADCVRVTITPTYSGCPAMHTMRDDIATALHRAGIQKFEILERLAPAWSSDWISPEGRAKLEGYGIAAPKFCGDGGDGAAAPVDGIDCPHCASSDTRLTSEFGSTTCKALYQCRGCGEPFDYFKPI